MGILLIDLKAQNASLRDSLEDAAIRVLRSGRYGLGDEVDVFQNQFANYCNSSHAIAVNSGTSALHLALLACGIGQGDEVITVAFTFVATIAAIQYTGARPVLVDIEPHAWTIDAEAVRAAVTPRTKAIIPVHLHGRPADMTALAALAKAHGLWLIEDASQAHGALHNGRRVGGIGDIGTFSFYPSKPLGALGEGGAVITNNPELAERIRLLRHWGQDRPNEHALAGFNMRMDAIQAAMLRVKLDHVDRWSAARACHARRYREGLGDSIAYHPTAFAGCSDVHHVFAIEVSDRDRVRAALTAAGIETGIHYPRPVHLQPAYANLGYRRGDFPIAERVSERTLSLPMFAEMTEQQVDEVCRATRQAIRQSESIPDPGIGIEDTKLGDAAETRALSRSAPLPQHAKPV
ncbi:DegT/DnrJ/EryC1/StrS aminotransferase family protein [Inquilinus sp. Marseille-Q2685]|uniref:DegT/DnrJ/EryC1/StrS family aminotransferase n=1 Tax=Inquilinus sp. Marseille-Q2685 TaxID=2866581 RepID=UPI001CE4AB0B|nr:DegT/DnrJ/EryC1/StrS family aminotransferase [Inquilinus sp. Marseille-Q2685]